KDKETVMPYGDVLDAETERIATIVVDSIFQVHKALGPGLLESVYTQCLVLELQARGLKVQREVYVPVIYREQTIPPGLRLDALVEDKIVIEGKSVEVMHPVFSKITKTYLT